MMIVLPSFNLDYICTLFVWKWFFHMKLIFPKWVTICTNNFIIPKDTKITLDIMVILKSLVPWDRKTNTGLKQKIQLAILKLSGHIHYILSIRYITKEKKQNFNRSPVDETPLMTWDLLSPCLWMPITTHIMKTD